MSKESFLYTIIDNVIDFYDGNCILHQFGRHFSVSCDKRYTAIEKNPDCKKCYRGHVDKVVLNLPKEKIDLLTPLLTMEIGKDKRVDKGGVLSNGVYAFRVPGGWIFKDWDRANSSYKNACFVPEPQEKALKDTCLDEGPSQNEPNIVFTGLPEMLYYISQKGVSYKYNIDDNLWYEKKKLIWWLVHRNSLTTDPLYRCDKDSSFINTEIVYFRYDDDYYKAEKGRMTPIKKNEYWKKRKESL
jgi:hypothetical protein